MPVFLASGLANVCHGDEIYPVIGGKVELPIADWYADLVAAGMLTPTPANDSGPDVPLSVADESASEPEARMRSPKKTRATPKE